MGPNPTLQLNANPYPNMEFVGWEGACGGTALTCTVRTGESVTVTARFKAPQVPVYINYMTVPGMALKVITSPQTQPQCKEVSSNQGLKSYQCRIDVAKGVPLSIWGYRSLGGGTMPSASGKNWGGACAGTPGDVCTIMPQQPVTVTIAPF